MAHILLAISSTTVDVLTNYTQTQDIPVYESTAATSVSGSVFVDSNGDSSDDSGDPGLAGVTVTLLNQYGDPATNLAGTTVPSTTTASDGSFSFGTLPDGTFTAIFSNPPTGYSLESTPPR
jgi:hypothetical protein